MLSLLVVVSLLMICAGASFESSTACAEVVRPRQATMAAPTAMVTEVARRPVVRARECDIHAPWIRFLCRKNLRGERIGRLARGTSLALGTMALLCVPACRWKRRGDESVNPMNEPEQLQVSTRILDEGPGCTRHSRH